MKIPPLQLSLGQVAWALSFGQPPTKHTLDRLTYLRQLGIPMSREDHQPGRGNRILYGYEDMVECGVALFALHEGMKPADVSKVLVGEREGMRRAYRDALADLPENALSADWVKSRGKRGAISLDLFFLRLHDRYSDKPGTFDLVKPGDVDVPEGAELFDPIERFADHQTRRFVPLRRLALQWTAWALEAPDIRPGRPS